MPWRFYGPASATAPGILTTSDQDLGGNKRWIIQHVDGGVAETLFTYRLDQDINSLFTLENGVSANGVFCPFLRFVNSTSNYAGGLIFQGGTDTGTTPMGLFYARIGASGAVSNRPLFDVRSGPNTVLSLIPLNSGAQSALKFSGSSGASGADPTVTTRATGTALVIKDTLAPGVGERAIGFSAGTLWYAVETSSVDHKFFAGGSLVATLKGTGQRVWTGGELEKTRVALTSPVTVATNDVYVESNLSSAGAVAVNLPSSPGTGMKLIIKDGKGDAGANNITITPAAGTIDGAATKVINTNYGAVRLIYNGTQWLTI